MPCPNCKCPSCINGSPVSSPDKLPPPSSNLTTKYFPPTDSEVVHSRDVIRSAEKAVPLIEAMIEDLEKQRAALLGLTKMHRAVILPLRSFPPEILIIIEPPVGAARVCAHGDMLPMEEDRPGYPTIVD
ncbi:hypothetical protein BD779DRAFT_1472872 [Infundibulicybe gibba]|nr:hypothetical protein BD779DRAFT_1472872 [Infundibulicybe gibba]